MGVLPFATSVSELWLTNNMVTDAGIATLAKWVATTKSLRMLCLYNNSWGSRGVEALEAALHTNADLNGGSPSVTEISTQGDVDFSRTDLRKYSSLRIR